MTNKNLFKEAHKMAREIKGEYPEVDYKFQFGLCLSYLLNKGEIDMVELNGSEKQVEWAERIREGLLVGIDTFKERMEANLKTNTIPVKGLTEERIQEAFSFIDNIREEIVNNESSKFFIDNFKGFANCRTAGHRGYGIEQQKDSAEFGFRGVIDNYYKNRLEMQIPKVIIWYQRHY